MNYRLLGIPIPERLGEWITELLEVPRRPRLALIWFGVMLGLLWAVTAILTGLYLAYT